MARRNGSWIGNGEEAATWRGSMAGGKDYAHRHSATLRAKDKP